MQKLNFLEKAWFLKVLLEAQSGIEIQKLTKMKVVAPRVENSNLLLQDLRDLCPLFGITG